MKWVNSGGGPLICGESRVLIHWLGITGLSVSAGTNTTTDYRRACLSRRYIESIPCNDGSALVLGDEPLQSSFLSTQNAELSLVRWIFARSSLEVEKFLLSHINDGVDLAHTTRLEVQGNALNLFDSALRGCDGIQNGLEAFVEPGAYDITTEKIDSGREFSFLIHRFIKRDI
jgi:hypothetical protein